MSAIQNSAASASSTASADQTPGEYVGEPESRESDPKPVKFAATAEEHILTRVRVTASDCWEWLGRPNHHGYGQTRFRKAHWQAHRLAWVTFRGGIPEGYEVDHLCRNRLCVNPAHLEAVPQRVNNLRSKSPTALNARKTHCPRGHEYDATRRTPSGVGRTCLTCKREADRRRYRKQRAL